MLKGGRSCSTFLHCMDIKKGYPPVFLLCWTLLHLYLIRLFLFDKPQGFSQRTHYHTYCVGMDVVSWRFVYKDAALLDNISLVLLNTLSYIIMVHQHQAILVAKG